MLTWIGYFWTAAALWFLASVVSAPVFLLVRGLRARSKRLFVDEPVARIRAKTADIRIDHRWDA